MAEPQSRIEQARRRAADAKKTLAAAAAAGFVVALGLAYASHPGIAAPGAAEQGSDLGRLEGDDSELDDFGFAPGSIAPSTGGDFDSAPQAQTHVS